MLFLAFLAMYVGILAAAGIHRPCWNDECHFFETILLFKTYPSLYTLIHYNEMSTPLPFVLYALWGTVFGDALSMLRMLSLLIAICTYCLLYYLFRISSISPKVSFLMTVFIALNPYMIGAGIFLFTDMLSILFEIMLLLGVKRNSIAITFVSSMGGLLSRQYFVFMVVAAILYFLWRFLVQKQRLDSIMVGALLLSTVPLAILVFLWKGLSPIASCREDYLIYDFAYHLPALTLYIMQLFIYMAPLVAVYWKTFYVGRGKLIFSLLLSWLYWLAPIKPSLPSIAKEQFTVGFFHRAIRIWPGEQFEQIIFFLCFVLAMPILLTFLGDLYQRIKNRNLDFIFFLTLSIVLFLIVMPFSYLAWEKYFLPLLSIIALFLALKTRQLE